MMMLNELNDYVEAIQADGRLKTSWGENFNVTVEEGRTYFKIVINASGASVHSFVVKADSEKFPAMFRKGDILKAASWKAPAKNFARGNVLDGDWPTMRWMGV